MSDPSERLARAVDAQSLFARAERILVAVSGGVDSMVLLDVLHRLSAKHEWRLAVAHFNHRLRGRASAADEALVQRVAARLGLRCFRGEGDIKALARAGNISIEMAARQHRHQFLAAAAVEFGARKIALAHHADDQVELFFVRLLRGTGAEGLGGMRPLSPSPANARVLLARPLLGISKAELLAYANANGVRYREDASNRRTEHLRNAVRQELVPLLLKLQPGLTRTVPRLMEVLRAESEVVEAEMGKRSRVPFGELPVAIQRRLIERQLIAGGVRPEFDRVETLRLQPDQKITVEGGKLVVREASGKVRLRAAATESFDLNEVVVSLEQSAGEVAFAGRRFWWKRESCRKAEFIRPAKAGTPNAGTPNGGGECFDSEKVGRQIILRHWRPGDRFHPIGAPQAVKLQDFFTNEKIPREQRRRLVVAVAADGRIFWIEGCRIAEGFKLDKSSRRVLIWRWRSE